MTRPMRNAEPRIYGAIVRLHPAAFRQEFGREMALDFDDARKLRGFTPLLGDALISLGRQWAALALNGGEPAPELTPAAAGHPFLAGQYQIADSGRLTLFDWATASTLSLLLVLAIGFAASVPNQHAIANTQSALANHDGGIDTGRNDAPRSGPNARHREALDNSALPLVIGNGIGPRGKIYLGQGRGAAPPGVGPRASGGPPARAMTLAEAAVQFTLISGIVWVVAFFFWRSAGIIRKAAIAMLGLLGIAASVAFGQAPMAPAPAPQSPAVAQLFHATGPMPTYEVATIKKSDPDARARAGGMTGPARGQTLRAYILNAYGVSSLSQGQLIGGPAWIGTDYYVIQGKVSDDLRDAMQKMTRDDQRNETLMLQESLLADRFAFKAHFETRDLPVYELAAAKGGFKFKEVAAPPQYGPNNPPPPRAPGAPALAGSIAMRTSGGVSMLRGQAIPMRALISLIRNDGGISGRPILDKTGFTGYIDNIDLKWSGLEAAPSMGGETSVDAPSLFTALEDSLGLKLTETKAPTEVLVIDHIERPSEN